MSQSSLYREDAIEAQRSQWLGRIVMIQPMSYSVLAMFASCLAAALIAFAAWGSYTKRVTVPGQLVPDKGLVKVYVQQVGTIVKERVTEGMHVNAGDVLFSLSSERQSLAGETQATISQQTQARENSLRQELTKTEQLRQLDRDAFILKIRGLRSELIKLHSLILGQQRRAALAMDDYKRYQTITEKGYVTQDQLTQRQADVLDQQSRLESLERDEISTQRNLVDAQNQLDTSAIKYDNQAGDIERNIATTKQDLSESEARRQLVVLAPESGIATAITAHLGQVVDTNKPIVSIVPEGSYLQADLYAPSRAVGFIKEGDPVHIRYSAYPYQKFGQNGGEVIAVAKTALSSSELTGTSAFATGNDQTAEPLYRISIRIDSQTIAAYGKQQALQAGMLLEADILHEKLKLYEWVLEPLYSLSEKL
jgi:membrane fusion protein